MKLIVRITSLLLLVVGLAGCVSPPESRYPTPRELTRAPFQRQEFIESFLQGKWCLAQSMFEQSLETYLRRDQFCQASYNYLLAWKLKKYIGEDSEALLENARKYSELGFGCPENPPVPKQGAPIEQSFSQRDAAYRALIQVRDYESLAKALGEDKDELYASVYGRKSALKAYEGGDTEAARMLLQQTRELDGQRGWVVFLLEDWRLYQLMTEDETQKELIDERINVLKALIEPCDSHKP